MQTWNNFGPARNYVSKKPYRGINSLILSNTDYEYPLFLTFLQVKELGGYIKKGSKSIEVIYWKTLEFENDEKIKRIPFLRYYNVFNVDCVDGVKLKVPTKYVNDSIECCENIINEMPSKPIIEHGGDEPFYNWKEVGCNRMIDRQPSYGKIGFDRLSHVDANALRKRRAMNCEWVTAACRNCLPKF